VFTKAKLFNLALNHLLLQRQIVDTVNDRSNECKVLNSVWDVALRMTLEDMDLDSTSQPYTLALLDNDYSDEWQYVYTYPAEAVFVRRLRDPNCLTTKDNRYSQIPKRIGIYTTGVKAIFTNQVDAVAEVIRYDMALTALSASAGLPISFRLAILSSPLITGKGADRLLRTLEQRYVEAKAQAQALDQRENFNFDVESIESEFVAERMS
jgi:hypothetical protein